MNILDKLLEDVSLPKMVKIEQVFDHTNIGDVVPALRGELARPKIADTVKPGTKVAVACGTAATSFPTTSAPDFPLPSSALSCPCSYCRFSFRFIDAKTPVLALRPARGFLHLSHTHYFCAERLCFFP